MDAQQEKLNFFLASAFADVLRLEERELARGAYADLSVSEMHVIEAVCGGQAHEGQSMTALAQTLGVSAGTLSVAVKTLVQKGYLVRSRAASDRRRVLVTPTAAALGAAAAHRRFHERLVEAVAARLSPAELETLAGALMTLHRFFAAL